ncbi:MAG: polyprenyl synthetase family protein [Treponema sp.]|jgi:octaprenyl-diphosphate synthase|nr:polyprenyl synthetase family protein [Treponema sp.]
MDTQYTNRLAKIEAVLDKWLPEKPDAAWLEMTFDRSSSGGSGGAFIAHEVFVAPELAATLTRPGWDLVKRGGKRWRPLLMLLTAESVAGGRGAEAALPLTPLIEFPHNASLIHDDIEDNSDERRGKPAVHLIYGIDAALNGGSFMYFLPLACLDKWAKERANSISPVVKERIWTAWTFHMMGLHLGQAMDIAWHRDYRVLPLLEEYDRMCRLKTGYLARLAAVLGVFCAGGDDIESAQLNNLAGDFAAAAEQLGVGFQILDDVKNLRSGNPGKKRGDDIVEGKKSLPLLLYLHRYPEKRDFTARCFAAARSLGTGAPEVEELIGALEGAGVLEEAAEKGLEYIQKSKAVFSAPVLSGLTLRKEGQELLSGFIDLLKG